MKYCIEVNDIYKKIENRNIIENLNFQVPFGNIFVLLGPNGAGKSTTIKLLNGILTPDKGEIKLFGDSLINQEVRENIGILSDSTQLYDNLTAEQNLKFFGELYGLSKREIINRTEEYLSLFKMEEYKKETLQGYSTGMKKRIQLIKSIIHDPDLVFLDEPTSGLDPESTKEVNDFIYNLSKKKNKTIFLCSHHLDEVEILGDQFGFLSNGNLFSQGKLEDLNNNLKTQTVFHISDKSLIPKTIIPYIIKIENDDLLYMNIENENLFAYILEQIINSNIKIFNIETIKPTLKDIYFSLLEAVKNEME